MRIYRYESRRGGFTPRLAVRAPGREAVDLAEGWMSFFGAEPSFGQSTLALIEAGPEAWADAARVAEASAATVDLEGSVLLNPLDRIASLRDFLAFESHVKLGAERRGGEVPSYWYEAPVYYKGNHRQLLGPDDDIPWPTYTDRLDFELELAMIVGRGGRDLQRADAADHVFGFTIFNDVSARDVQMREVTAWLGPAKGKDFANVFGPCIVTADEVGSEPNLEMICRVNDEEWGRGRSGQIHWKWADMLAHVSAAEDVYAGDVYGSGTPGGCCGLDLGRDLSPGDVVELEIENIGTLRNAVTVSR